MRNANVIVDPSPTRSMGQTKDPCRMRIAIVTETWPPEINGVALTVHSFVEQLAAQGHEIDLVRPEQDGPSLPPPPHTEELTVRGRLHRHRGSPRVVGNAGRKCVANPGRHGLPYPL
jgi:glycosyltransferase involved in cell wall biosynthesis